MLTGNPRHEFRPDDRPYDETTLARVTGHRQVTDAYLTRLATERGARLATFDRGLAHLRPDAVELLDA